MTRPLLAALCALAALPAAANDFVPGGNAGTLARAFALPALGAPAVLPARTGQLRVTLDVSSEYVVEGAPSGPEFLLLDGETTRLRIDWRRGLGGGWEAGVTLPYLWPGGGFLDGWIEDWHAAFGLPNGGRESAQDGQYEYFYRRNGATLLDVGEAQAGAGDVELTLGRALVDKRLALRALAKLPTGDGAELRGGNAGGALWLDARLPLPAGWAGYAAAGISYNDVGDVLPAMQKREAFFGGLGLQAPLFGPLALTAQLNAHTPLFEGSPLPPLGRAAAPLTLGLKYLIHPGSAIELGFQEDPAVNASPDFSAYLSLAL
jgi:hypothetical protein